VRRPGVRALRAIAAMTLVLAGPVVAGCGDSKTDKPTRTISKAEAASAARVASAERAAQAAPRDPDVLASLALAHVGLAYARGNVRGNTIGPAGEAELRKASDAWERYLALHPPRPNVQVATLMARAYGPIGLAERPKVIQALEIAAQNTKPRSGNLYAQLAIQYYGEKRFREGDRAMRRASALTLPNQRANLRATLRQIRLQAKTQGS
jgi:hypothetical protein